VGDCVRDELVWDGALRGIHCVRGAGAGGDREAGVWPDRDDAGETFGRRDLCERDFSWLADGAAVVVGGGGARHDQPSGADLDFHRRDQPGPLAPFDLRRERSAGRRFLRVQHGGGVRAFSGVVDAGQRDRRRGVCGAFEVCACGARGGCVTGVQKRQAGGRNSAPCRVGFFRSSYIFRLFFCADIVNDFYFVRRG
jgi:hypothetical protein